MVGAPGIPTLATGYVCPPGTRLPQDCVMAQGTLLTSSGAQQLSTAVTTNGLLYVASQQPEVSENNVESALHTAGEWAPCAAAAARPPARPLAYQPP